MFVVAWCGVKRAVVVPVEAYIRPLFRIKAFDVFVAGIVEPSLRVTQCHT